MYRDVCSITMGNATAPAHLLEHICEGSEGSCHIGAFSAIGLLPDAQGPSAQWLRLQRLS